MKQGLLLAVVLTLGIPVWAGEIQVSPNIQTAVGVQNAQQIQVGFGVRAQNGTIVQQQPQFQYIAPPTRERSYRYPGNTDIRVNPNVQTGVGVQNAQQIQVGLPNLRY